MEYKYSELTGEIIRCALQVHSFLGVGFQELIYQRALQLKFGNTTLNYTRELEVPIYYKQFQEPIGTRRVDFLVEEKVLVELKAVNQIEEVHVVQVLNYLKAFKLEVALLINFGEKSLKVKRLVL